MNSAHNIKLYIEDNCSLRVQFLVHLISGYIQVLLYYRREVLFISTEYFRIQEYMTENNRLMTIIVHLKTKQTCLLNDLDCYNDLDCLDNRDCYNDLDCYNDHDCCNNLDCCNTPI